MNGFLGRIDGSDKFGGYFILEFFAPVANEEETIFDDIEAMMWADSISEWVIESIHEAIFFLDIELVAGYLVIDDVGFHFGWQLCR